MGTMDLYLLGIAIILIGGIVSLAAPERLKSWIVMLFTGCGAALLIYLSLQVLFGGESVLAYYTLSYPAGKVTLCIDRLSSFFIIVISAMSFLGTLYAIDYMKPYCGKDRTMSSHFFFLSMLIASMLAVTIVQNVVAFLIVWEIMSLSSFFLVSFENEREEVYQAAFNYLIAMHVGILFLMGGFLTVSYQSGSFDFASFTKVFEQNRNMANLVFVLVFIGFGTKAGFVPLHTWLPKAHPAAPSHVSGLMSGIMIKTGIYGILRMILLIKNPAVEIGYFVLIISLISGIMGVASAIAQHNIKRLLAYHSVENIGIIGIGIGLGMLGVAFNNPVLATLGFAGGILHVLNHSIFKSLLFFSAGGVYQQTHTLNIEQMGGIAKFMVFSTVAFLIGSIAISGLPPFNGFVSEFLIYWGMLKGLSSEHTLLSVMMVISFTMLAIIGSMALICFTKVFGIVFLGSPRSEYHTAPTEVGNTMKIAMTVQIIMIVLIGIFPQYAFTFVNLVAQDFAKAGAVSFNPALYLNTLSQIATGLIIFIVIAAAILLLRKYLLRQRSVYPYKTWDCGYQAGNVRMQYTASSFAAPFISVMRPLYRIKAHLHKPEGIFPQKASYESHTEDKFEHGMINPVVNLIVKFLNTFTWIQSGSTQQYILYGLVFLIAITLWIMVI